VGLTVWALFQYGGEHRCGGPISAGGLKVVLGLGLRLGM